MTDDVRTAHRLDTDMSGWCPVTRHYRTDDGYLAVTRPQFVTAVPVVEVFAVDAEGVAASMEPLFRATADATHSSALEQLGYTVIDDIGDDDMGSP